MNTINERSRSDSAVRDRAAETLEAHIQRELPHLPAHEVAELARVVTSLVVAFQPEGVYVFGSQARGTPTPHSDVDLLIVVRVAEEPAYRLSQKAYGVIGQHTLPLDILFMTDDEFRWRARAAASLPAVVMREGRVLYAA